METSPLNQNERDRTLHKKFTRYGRNAKEWLRKCALLLPEIDRRQIWKQKGFGSIYEYVAKLAGMSKNQTREALRVIRKIQDKPELMKVVEERGINKVRLVATIATSETAKFWAEKVRDMTQPTLQTYVSERRKSHINMTSQPEKPSKTTIEMELDPGIAGQLQKMKGDLDWNTFMQELIDLKTGEKPEAAENAKRHVPVRIKTYVVQKTGSKCAFPGCFKEIYQIHHTQRFALERTHDPDRMWGLCREHNEIAHLGLIENEDGPPSEWELRAAPDRNDAKYWIDQQLALFRGG